MARFFKKKKYSMYELKIVRDFRDGKVTKQELDEALQTMLLEEHSATVLILPGCNHGNGMYKQTELYQGAIREFVEKYM